MSESGVGGTNMTVKCYFNRKGVGFFFFATAFGALLAPAISQAFEEVQQMSQAEARDANGAITVEASIIHVINCNGPGENGQQIYVYEYMKRLGFRAILPPNWGNSIGGGDYVTLSQAAGAGCR